jgi:hypothetical protein
MKQAWISPVGMLRETRPAKDILEDRVARGIDLLGEKLPRVVGQP